MSACWWVDAQMLPLKARKHGKWHQRRGWMLRVSAEHSGSSDGVQTLGGHAPLSSGDGMPHADDWRRERVDQQIGPEDELTTLPSNRNLCALGRVPVQVLEASPLVGLAGLHFTYSTCVEHWCSACVTA